MGKSRRGDKERSREQELKYENHKLRRQVSSLRKQLARIDLDRHSYIKETLEEHYANEEVVDNAKLLNDLKKAWSCKECGHGHLEIVLYGKMDETWYFRKCNGCPHRTKSQVYTPNVKGIIKETPLPDKNDRSYKKR